MVTVHQLDSGSGEGAAHVEPLATITLSPGAGASVQSTREGSGYQAYARFRVH